LKLIVRRNTESHFPALFGRLHYLRVALLLRTCFTSMAYMKHIKFGHSNKGRHRQPKDTLQEFSSN